MKYNKLTVYGGGQAYFSSLPGVDIHSEQHHKHHIHLSTLHQHRKIIISQAVIKLMSQKW
jgi:hypothetical protein